jgi:hypothetical protein
LIKFHDLRGLSATPSAHLVYDLAQALPPTELDALTTATGLDAPTALTALVMVSDFAWTVTIDGQPVAAYGTTPVTSEPDTGRFWLVATSEGEQHLTAHRRTIRKHLREVRQRHSKLITGTPEVSQGAAGRLSIFPARYQPRV